MKFADILKNLINNSSSSLDYFVGFMSLFIVTYRIIVVMVPMASQAVKDNDMSELFKSFTLLV
jgi:hypothetical protein